MSKPPPTRIPGLLFPVLRLVVLLLLCSPELGLAEKKSRAPSSDASDRPLTAAEISALANAPAGSESSSPKKKKGEPRGIRKMGKDIEALGEQVASRVDRIIKKKGFDLAGDPWTFQGIPLIFPSSANGFNLGVKVQMEDILTEDPHKLEVEAQILASDKGRYKDFLQVDYPHAFDGKYRVTGRVAYDRDISFNYYGIGNNTHPDQYLLNNTDYYHTVRAVPSLNLQLLRYMGSGIRMGPVLGLKWAQISAPPGSLLQKENPAGTAGGRTHTVGFAIIRDSLDFEPYPSRGTSNELYFLVSNHVFGSDYDYTRTTYTFRWYNQLHRRLILAHRTMAEYMSGNAPFYELSAVGGSNPTIGFGSDRYARGYDSDRFVDKLKFSTSWELRWDPIFFNFARQDINIGFVPFVDIARVWPTIAPWPLSAFHVSAGWGTRLIWNSRFIIRGDFVLNPEGTSFIVQLGNSF